MKKTIITIIMTSLIMLTPEFVQSQDFSRLVSLLRGASIIAQDDANTYLGKITSEYDSDSIWNEYGTYGSEYSAKSIWNNYGTFGNEYNAYSPFNDYSSTPPMIIRNGKVIGYLTINKYIHGAISPNLLKAIKDQF